jgi:hypothetical protein
MNHALRNTLCRLLIGLMIWTPFQMANAAMVGTDQVAPSSATLDRAHVLQALERADVQSTLQSYGVDPVQAKDRVQAMSDEEVRVLAQRIDALPAGGASAGAVILILVIIGVIWWAVSSGRMGSMGR